MKFDIDTYKEIIETLSRNKSRSFLTGFGVFWGIFMLMGLIGGGQGFRELLNRVFEGFATNSSVIFAQPTTNHTTAIGRDDNGRWNIKTWSVSRRTFAT